MKTQILKDLRSLSVVCWAVLALGRPCSAQTPPVLDLQLYAGLSITGTVGTVYSIQYVTDLAQTNNPSAWRSLESLQLPAMKDLVAKDPKAVRHLAIRTGEKPEDHRIVLTADTAELQQFVEEHLKTEGACGTAVELKSEPAGSTRR